MDYLFENFSKYSLEVNTEVFLSEWEADDLNIPFRLNKIDKNSLEIVLFQPRKSSIYFITLTDGKKHLTKIKKFLNKGLNLLKKEVNTI